MADDVALILDGRRYLGWTDVRIQRGLDSLVGSFDLELTERESTDGERWPLRAGAACRVEIGGELVITGFVDRLSARIDGQDHSIAVSGRDRAADIVDSSADNRPGSWRGASFETIVRELAAPFGVDLAITGDTGAPIERFALQQGEAAWSAIERLCRQRALIAWSQADGTVRIGNPDSGAPIARIVEGQNLLAGSAEFDVSERFSEYIVKGQASGSDRASGETVAAVSARAADPAITRHRPMVIVAEEQATLASLQKRADWEATTRAARGSQASITMQGWRTGAGALWDINRRVTLESPRLYADSEMLIAGVEFARGDAGTVTNLTLERPEAWSQLAVPEDADASSLEAN